MYLNGNNLPLWNNNAVFWYSRIISQGISFCSFWIINLFTYLHPSPPIYIPSHFLHYAIIFPLPKHYWNRWVWIIIPRESALSLLSKQAPKQNKSMVLEGLSKKRVVQRGRSSNYRTSNLMFWRSLSKWTVTLSWYDWSLYLLTTL